MVCLFHSVSQPNASTTKPLSLGVIFLTLYIDLIGFSIIFPLGPDLLKYYLEVDGSSGLLGWLLEHINTAARQLGNETHLPEVLFGGIIASVFSLLQFIFAPFWGSLSDKFGRRPILVWTVAGTAASYLIWVVSGSFWIFLAARILAGAFGGNLSVATAAVADVTSRAERAKAMGLVGAAFGLGLVTGPLLGAAAVRFNPLDWFPGLAAWGITPFSGAALLALALSVLNLVWIHRRFRETLSQTARGQANEPRLRNPLKAILTLDNAACRSVNLVAFTFSLAFVAMEVSLVFMSAERFGYTATQNGLLIGFLGLCSIITQGVIVRRLYGRLRETTVLTSGLLLAGLGLALLGLASTPGMLYLGVALLAVGGGFVNPSSTGLISLFAKESEQGRVLGIYRSLGALSRAITPLLAGAVFWTLGSQFLFLSAALLTLGAWLFSLRLPQPNR